MRWNNLFIFPLPCLHSKLNSLLCPIIYVSINISSPPVASFDQEKPQKTRMFSPSKNVQTHEKYLQLKKHVFHIFISPFPLQNHTNQSLKLWEKYLQMHVLFYFPFYSKNNTLTQTKRLSSYFFLSSFLFVFFFQL